MDIDDRIYCLREAGQDLFSDGTSAVNTAEQPKWHAWVWVVVELDARGVLASGGQPANQVIADLQSVDQDDI